MQVVIRLVPALIDVQLAQLVLEFIRLLRSFLLAILNGPNEPLVSLHHLRLLVGLHYLDLRPLNHTVVVLLGLEGLLVSDSPG